MAWITTFSGGKFDLDNLSGSDIRIIDIAHSLSMQCRFNGHSQKFYSVAQHSVLVARQIEDEQRPWTEIVWGLMHDAAEAYFGDIPRPFKKALGTPVTDLEQKIEDEIARRFHLAPGGIPKNVKTVDTRILLDERRDLLFKTDDVWEGFEGVIPLGFVIRPWRQEYAALRFLSEFSRLMCYEHPDLAKQALREAREFYNVKVHPLGESDWCTVEHADLSSCLDVAFYTGNLTDKLAQRVAKEKEMTT